MTIRHHEIDELLDDLSVRSKKQAGWITTAKTLSFKVRHHLKEEEAKFFQLAGRLLSARKKKHLAREYTREIVHKSTAIGRTESDARRAQIDPEAESTALNCQLLHVLRRHFRCKVPSHVLQ